MRLRRRRKLRRVGVYGQTADNTAAAGIDIGWELKAADEAANAFREMLREIPVLVPPLTPLQRAETANRHATELVDRLLEELWIAKDEARAGYGCYLGARELLDLVGDRLADFRSGDGSKPRQVLTDIEEILGSS